MNINKQVCTVAQAKKLKLLGVNQQYPSANWYWFTGDTGNNMDHLNILSSSSKMDDDLSFAAFTVAELGIMIPPNFILPVLVPEEIIEIGQKEGKWAFYDRGTSWTNCETEAEARAELLIDLIEVVGINVEEINKRLLQ